MKAIEKIKITVTFRCYPFNNAIAFLMQDNVILLQLESLKELLVFHDLSFEI